MSGGISKNSVSIAGEFATLSQLSLRGLDASLTLGNTKAVDILVSNPKSGNLYRIEVKTRYDNKPTLAKLFGKTLGWVMSEKHESVKDKNLFFCFVNILKEKDSFQFFVVPSSVVGKYVKTQHDYWLSRNGGKHKNVKKTTMRAFRIGLDDKGYQISTPLAKDYEDAWKQLK